MYKKAVQFNNKTQKREEQRARVFLRPNSDFVCKLTYYFVSVLSYSLENIHQEQKLTLIKTKQFIMPQKLLNCSFKP